MFVKTHLEIGVAIGVTVGVFLVFFTILIGFIIYWRRCVTDAAPKLRYNDADMQLIQLFIYLQVIQ